MRGVASGKEDTVAMFKWILMLVVGFNPAWASTHTVLVLGDSISAAYGLSTMDSGWVALLQKRLAPQNVQVLNASIPGDTTAGGLARIAPLLAETKPAVVIVELGANDGLRGLTLDQMYDNLVRIVDLSTAAGAKVLLLGMRLPPNYGRRYTDAFAAVFARLAEERHIAYVPFLMDGVGGHENLMQGDGLHPNEAAQSQMLDHVWPTLRPLLNLP